MRGDDEQSGHLFSYPSPEQRVPADHPPHQSTTDPDSRLFKKAKGHEAKLAYLGEVLMENRHGLVVDACVVPAIGTGERDAAVGLIAGWPPRPVTLGGDKGYDTRSFVETLRDLEATPHVALKKESRTLD